MLVTWLFGGNEFQHAVSQILLGLRQIGPEQVSTKYRAVTVFSSFFLMLFLTVPRLFGGQGQVIKRKKAWGNIHLNWKVTTNIVGAELRTILYQSIFVLIIFSSVFLSSNVMSPFYCFYCHLFAFMWHHPFITLIIFQLYLGYWYFVFWT